MSTFDTIACLITHAPVEAAFTRSGAAILNDTPNSSLIPGWDHQLHDNVLRARVNDTTGLLRGQAFGVSNPVSNLRSRVGATFRFQFIIRTDQVVFDQGLYTFRFDIRSEGQFIHTPAVPFPDDQRAPAALTTSQMDTTVLATVLDQNGVPTSNRSIFPTRADHNRTQFAADGGFREDIDTLDTIEAEVRLPSSGSPGAKFVRFTVERRIIVTAVGEFSDCQIKGAGDNGNFRVVVENARIQKVLQPDDPCFDVLHS